MREKINIIIFNKSIMGNYLTNVSNNSKFLNIEKSETESESYIKSIPIDIPISIATNNYYVRCIICDESINYLTQDHQCINRQK